MFVLGWDEFLKSDVTLCMHPIRTWMIMHGLYGRVFRLRMAALRYEALDNATGITMEVGGLRDIGMIPV